MRIPLHKPFVDERALENVREVFCGGKLSGDGPVCRSVEQEMARMFSYRRVLLTTSCTHALEMGMMLLGLRPGDEVIVPSFTFVSTANAVLRAGGRPVFCDINDRTLTMDVGDLSRRITPKTRAIVPVHYAGVAAEMDEILDLARRHGLAVVEDAAQGVNARYRGKFLGTIGDAGALSFHDTKNYVSGEGGAFVTDDEALARRAEVIREKGTNRENFLRGEVDKYTWVGVGSSFILSEILAALLKYQLGKLAEIQEGRRRVHRLYTEGLAGLEQSGRLRLPVIPDYCESNFHIFYIRTRTLDERVALMSRLKEAGIGAAFHYVPLHSAPYAVEHLGTQDVRLPVTDEVFATLLRLPMYPQLTDAEVGRIVETIHASLP
jgi:dTDP-4-amino-4,6-dideoxygalactose transaminase